MGGGGCMWEWVGGCGFLGVCVYGCVCVLWGGGGGKINETVIKKTGHNLYGYPRAYHFRKLRF